MIEKAVYHSLRIIDDRSENKSYDYHETWIYKLSGGGYAITISKNPTKPPETYCFDEGECTAAGGYLKLAKSAKLSVESKGRRTAKEKTYGPIP